ncbi:MAG: radical SAM protein [Candidatus Omnitrophica bacterium]|nr:radical SAM protein [Candidatus Omnitrophota bacterium]MDE2009845.1 radical SAM protein [Candidatus Omnitrophota bacterium]MDE2214374.1 radical SAM protein [Candidatus Omnitrophota bacterium]MDE2231123.1 radical SAM protein [Candidatus Omnitrophota bacterium]
MDIEDFRYIYGPVQSWRMGKSLGIDPLSDKVKVCNLDCVYCQLGKTRHLTNERKEYVDVREITAEIARFFEVAGKHTPCFTEKIDFITFSGRGEPTLAKNLGEMILALRAIRDEKIAVITNSTLMHLSDVQQDLALADVVMAKLDAFNTESFLKIDKPIEGISFERIVKGVKEFKGRYKGRLALQIMFMGQNQEYARKIASLAREIMPDEIQINTPLRPCGVRPLNKGIIKLIKSHFDGLPAVTVYDRDIEETRPFNVRETIKRHGNFKNRVSQGTVNV